MSNTHVRRNFKDSLFRMIFREKEELLSLYNAINGSDYTEPEALEIRMLARARLQLPAPRYIVFYNSMGHREDCTVLRLSDSFPKIPNGECALECTAVVLNINYGHNKEIMEGCRKLYEYSFFVEEIRKGLIQGLTLEGAVSGAMDTCVHSNILEPFLRRHRAEVHALILEEYDEELHIRNEKELSYQEGHTAGVSYSV